jgi:hypothetical protein
VQTWLQCYATFFFVINLLLFFVKFSEENKREGYLLVVVFVHIRGGGCYNFFVDCEFKIDILFYDFFIKNGQNIEKL